MTSKELKDIIKIHNKWLVRAPGGVRANLIDANLTGADLRYTNLKHANLIYADLEDVYRSKDDLRTYGYAADNDGYLHKI